MWFFHIVYLPRTLIKWSWSAFVICQDELTAALYLKNCQATCEKFILNNMKIVCGILSVSCVEYLPFGLIYKNFTLKRGPKQSRATVTKAGSLTISCNRSTLHIYAEEGQNRLICLLFLDQVASHDEAYKINNSAFCYTINFCIKIVLLIQNHFIL